MASPEVAKLFARFEAEPSRDPVFAPDVPLYIYGAGNAGKDVSLVLREQNLNVTAFLDRKATPGATWENIPILAPDSADVTAADRRRAHVIIGIFNRDVEIPPIVRTLESLGYGRITTFPDFYEVFPDELGDRFWLAPRDFYRDKQEPISCAYELYSDDESRALFLAVLEFRMTHDYAVLPTPNLADQYFPTGLPPWRMPLRLVDCGAYDGDTLRFLVAHKIPVDVVASYEPDPANFLKLRQTALELFPDGATASVYEAGVSAETDVVRFSSGQGEASSASNLGEMDILCVALDDVLPAFRPNLIKMDIEGAEPDALRGARKIITRNRPGLAISVYHRAEQLWTLPLQIAEMVPGGRHFLRAHGHSTFDVIHYWMPSA